MSKKKKRPAPRLSAAKTADPASPAPVPAARDWSGLGIVLAKLEPFSVAALFIFLLARTWMRWSDALIDFPRDLYTAWRLSEGDLLYTNLSSWYGPLSHLLQAAAFRLFGVGLDTMVWLNVVVTISVLLLVRAIFGQLANRFVVWLCSVVFLVVFAFAEFTVVANYNFITPYASQATYGLLGCLLTVWALLRQIRQARAGWLWLAGAGVGIAYLDKPEPLLAAAGACAVFFAVHGVRLARETVPVGGWGPAARWCGRTAGWMAAGFFSLWLPVFLVLARMGGWAYAVRATNWVVHTVASGSFRTVGTSSKFNAAIFGFDKPGLNFLVHLAAGGLLVGAGAVIVFAGRVWMRSPAKSWRRWAALGLGGGVVLTAVWLVNWVEFGCAVVFPAFLAAAFMIGLAMRAAWQRRAEHARRFQLAVTAAAAALMLARIPLNGNIHTFGFFMEPLAIFFLLDLLIVEAPRAAEGREPPGIFAPAAFGAIALYAVFFLGRDTLTIYSQKNYLVGQGRDQFYSFPSEVNSAGYLVNSIKEEVEARVHGAHTLLALPESAGINYHLRMRNPIAETEFQPTTLDFVGRAQVLSDLARNPPDIIVVYSRNLDEYGVPYFGVNEYAGSAIENWIMQNYNHGFALRMASGPSPYSLTGNIYDMYLRKTPSP